MGVIWLVVLLHGCILHLSPSFFGCALAATFCAIIYAIFKLLLPMVLFVRVIDILRFRYAFYILCAAGAMTVGSSCVFWKAFSAVDVNSVGLVLGAAAVLANMVFMRYGGRMLLVGSYLVAGSLCACGIVGVFVMVLIWVARYMMVYKLNHSFALIMAEADDRSSDYLIELKVVLRSSGMAKHCRISCALMFLLGFGAMLLFRVIGSGASRSDAIKSVLGAPLVELKQLICLDTMIPILSAVAMLLIAFSFIRVATDVFERLRGNMMLAFAVVLAVSLGWSVGIVDRLPPFSMLEVHSIIPDILVAYALVLSGSVFIIELGCRELSALNAGYVLSASPELLTRKTRSLRVLAFSLSIIAIVVLTPFMLR